MFKIGLVGYGFMGKMHSQCYNATGMAKMVAIADVDPAKRAEAKEKFGCDVYDSVEAMLESAEIDVVDVCTPTYLHEPVVLAAAKAGKHIMCEKPMSISVKSTKKMIQAAEKAGVTFMVAQVIRFWPEYKIIKDMIDSGKYGKVKFMSASRLSGLPIWSWDNWLLDPKRSGGALLDLHIHDIDFFNYVLGFPKSVYAVGVKGPHGSLDTSLTVMEHASGVKSFAQGTFDLAGTYPFTMALLVNCEKGSFRYDLGSTPSLMVYPEKGKPFAPKLPKEKVGKSTEKLGNVSSLGGYYIEIKYFLDCIKAGKKPETVTPGQASDSVRVCLAAAESIKTGKKVKP